MHVENVVVGTPLVEPQRMLASDENDWETVEKQKTLFTEERSLAAILKMVWIVPSTSEVRRNKPEYAIALNKPDYIEVKWGKKRLFVVVGV